MAEPTIEIIIAAQAQQFNAEIAALQKRIKSLEASLGKGTQRGLNRFTKATNQGQNALRDFSRVVQDAPFGIIGVGNNIQELAGSFGFLVRSAGGVRGAFAAIGAALAGPGGLILLVSAVTTALTVFQQRSQKAEKAAKSFLETLREGLATNSQDSDILRLQRDILKLQGRDYTKILQRLIEIELQDIKRLENLQEQNKKTEDLAKTTAESLKNIEVAGFLLEKVWDEVVKQVKDLGDEALEGLRNATGKYIGAITEVVNNLLEAQGIYVRINKEQIAAAINAENEAAQTKKSKDFTQAKLEAQKRLAQLRKEETEAIKAQNELLDRQRSAFTLGNLLADIFSPDGGPAQGLQEILGKFIDFAQKLKGQASTLSQDLTNSLTAPALNFGNALQGGLDRFILFAQRLADGAIFIQGAISNVVDVFNNNLGPAISNFGQILGQQLQQGVAFSKALGNAFLGGLSTLANAVADELIRLGALTLAIGKVQTALENLTPGPGKIAAGLAAIAVGTALKGLASAARGASLAGASSGGGISSASPAASVGGPEFASDVGEQQVIFEIEGQKLVGVLNNTLSRRGRVSGRLI